MQGSPSPAKGLKIRRRNEPYDLTSRRANAQNQSGDNMTVSLIVIPEKLENPSFRRSPALYLPLPNFILPGMFIYQKQI